MPTSPRELLQHILDECGFVAGKVATMSREGFLAETAKRALVRSLEIVGEAAKSLPDSFRTRHATVDWKAMAGMRDVLIHRYFGVDYELVWDVATSRLPGLSDTLNRILAADSSLRP